MQKTETALSNLGSIMEQKVTLRGKNQQKEEKSTKGRRPKFKHARENSKEDRRSDKERQIRKRINETQLGETG